MLLRKTKDQLVKQVNIYEISHSKCLESSMNEPE